MNAQSIADERHQQLKHKERQTDRVIISNFKNQATGAPAIVLTFTTDDPLNTALTLAHGPVFYEAITPHKRRSNSTTVITRLGRPLDEVIARVEWAALQVVLPRLEKPLWLGDFLARAGLFSKSRVFRASDGRLYKWKHNPPELYDPDGRLIARYHARREASRPSAAWQNAHLDIMSREAQDVMDEIVISCLILRHTEAVAARAKQERLTRQGSSSTSTVRSSAESTAADTEIRGGREWESDKGTGDGESDMLRLDKS